jgi:hypothetical protein
MKKVLLLLLIFNFSFLITKAQAPQAIPYQAVARDNSGNPLDAQTISLRFSIHDVSATGPVVYQETHSVTTNSLGLFTANIGQGAVVSGTFSTIDWGGGSKFIQVELDTAGGIIFVDMGTQQMLSVPYALHAGSSGDWGKTGSDIYNLNSGNVGIGTTTPAAKLDVSADALINLITIGRGGGNISSNTANGWDALYSNTGGFGNTSIGFYALKANTMGSYNTAAGSTALISNTQGNNNSAFGNSALFRNTTGSSNTATGSGALFENTTGDDNTAIGNYALSYNTTGLYNTATGSNALVANTVGIRNTANGAGALSYNTTGNFNTANGASALYSNIDGFLNTANGESSLYFNTSGSRNTAQGHRSLYFNSTGSENTALGMYSLLENISGSYNTAIGFSTLRSFPAGNNNTAIGYKADVVGNLTNATAIGSNAAVEQDNSLVLGSINGVNFATANTNVGIGTTTPTERLDVAGKTKTTEFQMTNGAATGNILQSDVSGNASWVAPASLSITETDPKVGSTLTNQIPKWNGTTLSDGIITDNGSNVGIGTISPASKLDIAGKIKITDGTEGLGKVLTSDAAGLASWATPSGGLANGALAGNTPYWNGTSWVTNSSNIFNNGGNVGIGTTTPANKLDVVGAIKVSAGFKADNGSASVASYRFDSDANTGLFLPVADNLAVTTNGSEKMRITSAGNVGIGTTTPADKLTVQTSGYGISQTDGTVSVGTYINASGGWLGTKSNHPLYFFTSNNNPSMTLTTGGNLGIGTLTPIAPLQFSNSLINNKVVLFDCCNSDHQFYGFGVNTNSLRYQVAESISSHVFYAGSSASTSNELMRIQGNGNVGIGTSTPASKLDVAGSLTVGATYAGSNAAPANGAIIEGSVGIGTNIPNNPLHLVTSSIPSAKYIAVFQNLTNAAGGSQGLEIQAGTDGATGTSRLINFRRPDATTLGSIVQNSVSSVAYLTTSDIRLKTNIKESQYGLKTILNIQVKDYNYKDDLTRMQTGFIAQQLYEQFPQSVAVGGEDPKSDPWMVDYSRLSPVLVKAVQELQVQIEALKAENEKLKAENGSFKTDIEKIKAQLGMDVKAAK